MAIVDAAAQGNNINVFVAAKSRKNGFCWAN
jgi:hypothetical protein